MKCVSSFEVLITVSSMLAFRVTKGKDSVVDSADPGYGPEEE
jgi:hypothetical protein